MSVLLGFLNYGACRTGDLPEMSEYGCLPSIEIGLSSIRAAIFGAPQLQSNPGHVVSPLLESPAEIFPKQRFCQGVDRWRGEAPPSEIEASRRTDSDGNVYTGSLMNGVPHGQGTMTYANGDVYKGDFDNGKRHGQGTMTYESGDIYYVGSFFEDKRHGEALYSKDTMGIYKGNFVNGAPHGQGTLTNPYGDVYTGSFINGIARGQGTLKYANGTTYIGSFSFYSPRGFGTFIYANGDVYTGNVVAGLRQGEGTLRCARGNVYSGIFYQDEMLSDKSHLGDLLFVRLLFGYQARGSRFKYSLGILSDYFKEKIDRDLANSLVSACQPAQSNAYIASQAVYQKLLKGDSCLLRYGYQGHAMGLNLVPTQDGQFIDCEIFNSGSGLNAYHQQKWVDGKKKYETMLKIRVPAAALTPDKIKQLIEHEKFLSVKECYDAILAIPDAKKIPGTGVLQAEQKDLNCELEWIFAFLKNKMSIEEYNAMRLQLFIDCLRKAKENEKKSLKPLTSFLPEEYIRRKLNKLLGRDLELCTGPLFEEGLHLVKFETACAESLPSFPEFSTDLSTHLYHSGILS